jgi:endogenous inhibitor of DNA gyrase (YacG/DUF329 family)
MIKVQCPICQREMTGQSEAAWPQFPFCSPRCKLVDLGRWLGEKYGYPIESATAEETAPESEPADGPP